MKVLVPIKRVVDYNVRIRIKSDQSGVETSHVKMSINPFDEIALEEAIRLREKGIVTSVVVASIGSSSVVESLRVAYALGADRALHIASDDEMDSFSVAKILKGVVEKESFDFVIMGKQAIDDDANQTGQMLAGFLNWPQATFISSLEIANNKARVSCEVDQGALLAEVMLPAVFTVDLRLNTPRLATLPNIMKAKQKTIESLQAKDFYDVSLNPFVTKKVVEPKARNSGKMVSCVDDLVSCLVNEAKVI